MKTSGKLTDTCEEEIIREISSTIAFKAADISTAFNHTSEAVAVVNGVKLWLSISSKKDGDKFGVYLMSDGKVAASPTFIKSYSFSLLAQDKSKADKKSYTSSETREISGLLQGFGYDKMFGRDLISNPAAGYLITEEGVGTFHIKVTTKITSKKNVLRDPSSHVMNLLFLSTKLSDVTVLAKKADGTTAKYPAHQCILAVRSDYFNALFTGPMSEAVATISVATSIVGIESSTNTDASSDAAGALMEVRLDDFPSQVVKASLQFLYTGTMDYSVVLQSPLQLLQLAMFLQSEKLQYFVEQSIKGNVITTKNYLALLNFADTNSLPTLNVAVLEYIRTSDEIGKIINK